MFVTASVLSLPCLADENIVLPVPTSSPSPEIPQETIKVPEPEEPTLPINAKKYNAKIIKRSKSTRVFLIETSEKSTLGRILLLKKNTEPVMAFRVLKLYDDKNQIAAKRVKTYEGHELLENEKIDPTESYTAIEKISDITPPPPPTAEDKQDLKDLEKTEDQKTKEPAIEGEKEDGAKESLKDENEEEKTEEKSKTSDSPDLSDDEDRWLTLTAEEVFPIDPNPFGFSVELSYIRVVDPNGNAYYPSGGGLRLSLRLFQLIFLKKSLLQDSLSLEAGAFLIKILNFNNGNNVYTMAPFLGTLRYTVLTSENFGFFFYGGLLKSVVLSSINPDNNLVASFESFQPAGGAGMIFRIGPNWEARFDLGIDMIGAGIMLRF